jgi:prolyl oligopeptidase PreP (S9A serine peptidase family)
MNHESLTRHGPYPEVLLTTALRDPRVEPWQVAKMTARLQKATTSKNLALPQPAWNREEPL